MYVLFLSGLGLVKVGATVVSLCLVDRLGRRTLLLFGNIIFLLKRSRYLALVLWSRLGRNYFVESES